MVFMMMPYRISHTHSYGFISFQNTRKCRLNFVGCTTPTIFRNFTRHSRSHWCFQLLTRVLDGLLEFRILGVDEIDSRQFSRWILSSDNFCFSFSLACFPIDSQSSGHIWSGLEVNCFLVNLSPDHVNPSRAFSSSRVNCVKPVQRSDKSREPSMFQKSSMRFSCLTSKFVWVVLVTSLYFSGIGNDSSLGE